MRRWMIAAGVAVLVVASVGSGAQAGGWSTPDRVGPYSEGSMVVTPSGVIHLAARSDDGLFHLVRRLAGGWTATRLTRDIDKRDPGGMTELRVQARVPALARDPVDGSLVLAYRTSVMDGSTGGCGGDLFVARRDDGAWPAATRVQVADGCAGGEPSIRSRDGRLFLATGVWRAYGFWDNTALLWAETDGWHGRLVQPSDAPELDGPGGAILLVDPGDRMHVAYSTPGSVRYASTADPATTLERERVAFTAGRAKAIALALDGSRQPVVAWTGSGGVALAQRSPAGSWQVTRLPWTAHDVALALDLHGRPHLLLAQGASGVRHAWRTATGWRSERLDTRSSRSVVGLAFDHAGRLVAAWQHGRAGAAPTIWLRRRAG